MYSRTLLATAALFAAGVLSGCGGPAAKLHGKWQMAANAGGGNPLLAMLASSMKGELDFRGDGSFSMAVKTPLGDKSTTGNWKFASFTIAFAN